MPKNRKKSPQITAEKIRARHIDRATIAITAAEEALKQIETVLDRATDQASEAVQIIREKIATEQNLIDTWKAAKDAATPGNDANIPQYTEITNHTRFVLNPLLPKTETAADSPQSERNLREWFNTEKTYQRNMQLFVEDVDWILNNKHLCDKLGKRKTEILRDCIAPYKELREISYGEPKEVPLSSTTIDYYIEHLFMLTTHNEDKMKTTYAEIINSQSTLDSLTLSLRQVIKSTDANYNIANDILQSVGNLSIQAIQRPGKYELFAKNILKERSRELTTGESQFSKALVDKAQSLMVHMNSSRKTEPSQASRNKSSPLPKKSLAAIDELLAKQPLNLRDYVNNIRENPEKLYTITHVINDMIAQVKALHAKGELHNSISLSSFDIKDSMNESGILDLQENITTAREIHANNDATLLKQDIAPFAMYHNVNAVKNGIVSPESDMYSLKIAILEFMATLINPDQNQPAMNILMPNQDAATIAREKENTTNDNFDTEYLEGMKANLRHIVDANPRNINCILVRELLNQFDVLSLDQPLPPAQQAAAPPRKKFPSYAPPSPPASTTDALQQPPSQAGTSTSANWTAAAKPQHERSHPTMLAAREPASHKSESQPLPPAQQAAAPPRKKFPSFAPPLPPTAPPKPRRPAPTPPTQLGASKTTASATLEKSAPEQNIPNPMPSPPLTPATAASISVESSPVPPTEPRTDHATDPTTAKKPSVLPAKRAPIITDLPLGDQRAADYTQKVSLSHGTAIGICEIQGARKTQEDAIAYDAGANSKAFSELPYDTQKLVMQQTFQNLQEKCGQNNLQGSTACVATGYIKDTKVVVSTSHVGDSVSFLVILDKDGNLRSSTACNPNLHDADNAKEVYAVENGIDRKKGTMIADSSGLKRLHGSLAVTRAFGDNHLENHGLSHIPETTTKLDVMNEGDRAYMVVACDGAMEHCKKTGATEKFANELGALFAQSLHDQPEISPEILAEQIVNNAYQQDSRDNISAMVIPLTTTPVTAAIFDGHGGSDVSKALAENFSAEFTKTLENEKLFDASAKHKPIESNRDLKKLHEEYLHLCEKLDKFEKNHRSLFMSNRDIKKFIALFKLSGTSESHLLEEKKQEQILNVLGGLIKNERIYKSKHADLFNQAVSNCQNRLNTMASAYTVFETYNGNEALYDSKLEEYKKKLGPSANPNNTAQSASTLSSTYTAQPNNGVAPPTDYLKTTEFQIGMLRDDAGIITRRQVKDNKQTEISHATLDIKDKVNQREDYRYGMFTSISFPNSNLIKIAAQHVLAQRALAPYDPIVITKAPNADYVEAVMLFCKSQKYPVVNQSGQHVPANKINPNKVNAFLHMLDKDPDKFCYTQSRAQVDTAKKELQEIHRSRHP